MAVENSPCWLRNTCLAIATYQESWQRRASVDKATPPEQRLSQVRHMSVSSIYSAILTDGLVIVQLNRAVNELTARSDP